MDYGYEMDSNFFDIDPNTMPSGVLRFTAPEKPDFSVYYRGFSIKNSATGTVKFRGLIVEE